MAKKIEIISYDKVTMVVFDGEEYLISNDAANFLIKNTIGSIALDISKIDPNKVPYRMTGDLQFILALKGKKVPAEEALEYAKTYKEI